MNVETNPAKRQTLLFQPLRIRGVELPNRIAVSPMCQYSSVEGLANNWHMVHLGCRAVGGAGLVIAEATAICPEGRITPDDLGLWSDEHAFSLKPITQFITESGSVPGVQLAHAGRRAARTKPWDGHTALREDETWQVVGPSALAFDKGWQTPAELSHSDLEHLLQQFVDATERSREAGFKVIELHMAHGYLLHEFLSPLTNLRSDEFGGDLRGRCEFPLRVIDAVRAAWPDEYPLFVRISAMDWLPGGLDLDQSIQISEWMKERGVDLIDCSSGAIAPGEKMPYGTTFQVPFAARIKQEANIMTGAVGFILQPQQAAEILDSGHADLAFLARALLYDPYWPRHAAVALGQAPHWPIQYARAVRHFHDDSWRPNALGPGQAMTTATSADS